MSRIDRLESSIMIDEEILATIAEAKDIDYDKYIKLASDIAKDKEELADLYENTDNI